MLWRENRDEKTLRARRPLFFEIFCSFDFPSHRSKLPYFIRRHPEGGAHFASARCMTNPLLAGHVGSVDTLSCSTRTSVLVLPGSFISLPGLSFWRTNRIPCFHHCFSPTSGPV